MLDALGLDGTVLVVLSRADGVAARALRNLARVTTVDAGELNAYDVLAHDWVLFTDETLPTAEPADREADAIADEAAAADPDDAASGTAADEPAEADGDDGAEEHEGEG